MIIKVLYFLYLISYSPFGKIVMSPNILSLKEADDQSIIWVIMEKKFITEKQSFHSVYILHILHTSKKERSDVRNRGHYLSLIHHNRREPSANKRSEWERLNLIQNKWCLKMWKYIPLPENLFQRMSFYLCFWFSLRHFAVYWTQHSSCLTFKFRLTDYVLHTSE